MTGSDLRVGQDATDGTGDDDRAAAAAGQQVRDPGLHRFPHTAQVDVDRLVPALLRHLVQLGAGGPDTRVGNDDVETTQLFDAAVHRRLQRVVIPHIDFGGTDAAIQVLDHVGGLGEIFWGRPGRRRALKGLADVDGDDVGALFGQPNRVAAALTARRAGDERDLAFYPSGHQVPSTSRRASWQRW